LEELPQYANIDLLPGRLLIEGPGGGGFGIPFDRPTEEVSRDVRNGLVSPEGAIQDYGVALDLETFEVDEERTRLLRRKKLAENSGTIARQ
jgi:N-methylhydantoinase B